MFYTEISSKKNIKKNYCWNETSKSKHYHDPPVLVHVNFKGWENGLVYTVMLSGIQYIYFL